MAVATVAELDAAVSGQTVTSQFATCVRRHGDRVALRWKHADGGWGTWTYRELAERTCAAAAGLVALGIEPGEHVILMLRNRPEFNVCDMATLLCGAIPISIYNSSSPEQVHQLASHSEAAIAIVDDVGILERFLKVRADVPGLRRIVVVDDPEGLAPADVVPFGQLLGPQPVDLDEAAAVARPGDVATVIYTSGTTGDPKGVMLSHANICYTAESLRRCFRREEMAGLRFVSYLPMAHIAERMVSYYMGSALGYDVTTCPDPTQLVSYLLDVRPQVLFGVPRVWEKIYAGVQGALAADPDKAEKFGDGVEAAKPIATARAELDGGELPADMQELWDFLDAVAFRQVRERVGLDALELAISGAAPLPVEVLEWFRAIGVPLSEIYGLSECSGPMTWEPYRVKPGTVGRPIPGCEVKLLDDGEVACRGGNVFLGYLKDPALTAQTLGPDGWLHSGDIGEIDDEGYLRIVDRKKELIITAGGKNISPASIEAALKSFPLIGQACVVGDNRPFIGALIVLDPEVAPAWARARGIEAASLAELAAHPEVDAEVQRSVNDANARFSQAERVKRYTILGEEWLPDSEELTPTMKVKRRGISVKYAEQIEALYST
jgi:long-chain acyl-CoA synthetase